MSFTKLVSCAGLASAALGAAMAQGVPSDGAGLKGVYGGSYTCGDGEHGFYLSLTKVAPRKGGGFSASGVLGFFPVLAGKAGSSAEVAGSFNVAGGIGADGAVALTAGKWLKKPDSYGAANLEGKLEARADGGFTIKGKPVVPGNPSACSDLVATQFLPPAKG